MSTRRVNDIRPREATFGVVIPVRNGEAHLGATLTALAGQDRIPAESASAPVPRLRTHIVVAVNGSSDGSARIAERFASEFERCDTGFTVVETRPGRAAAFNEAEQLLAPGPRLYLDQDAVLAANALAVLAAALGESHPRAEFAVPQLRLPALRSVAARAYYRTFLRLPYTHAAPVSLGAYAVSAAGRSRWDQFPDVHSDDKFVRLHFAARERILLADTWYTVALPDSTRAVVRARRRYSRGNRELALRFPALAADEDPRYARLWREIALRPAHWSDAAVYAALHGAGHLLARAGNR